MLTLQQIMDSQSNILNGKQVKIIRHKDNRAEYRDVMKDKDRLIEYQREQSKHVFKDCDYIISCVGIDRNQAILFGVFKVGDHEFINDHHYYDLDRIGDFTDLENRLIIDWGSNAISWHQWYNRHDKKIVQVLPDGYVGHFPGLLNFVLEFDELQKIINHPDANHDWCHNLSSVNGIYMILDDKTGHQYIGSANGKEGIWQRWREYASNYTGGNKRLSNLIENDPHYYKNFKYSILQTLPSNITQREIVAIENLYKEKLGSRTHGLNRN